MRLHCTYLVAGSCVLVMTMVTGCSRPCSSQGAVGKYKMTVGGHIYELRLATGGLGTLSRDAKAENIKWEWNNEQVFLDLSGDLAKDLAVLSAPLSQRDAAAKTQRVYLGLAPQCRSGRTTELDLRFEEPEPRFSRSE